MRTEWFILPISVVMLSACNSDGIETAAEIAESPGALDIPLAPRIFTLDAAQVVGGSAESGHGSGALRVERATGAPRGTVFLTDIEATEVSLNRGYAGEVGPVLVYFDRISATEWSLPLSATLAPADVAAMDSGGLYVIAATAGSPAGAVRGQVVQSRAVSLYFHTLFGMQVVPAVTSSATATLAITQSTGVSESGTVGTQNDIIIHVNVHGLNDVTSVHVHKAYAGANGPVIVDLLQDPANPGHWFTSTALLDSVAGSALRRGYCINGSCDPLLYVDVHTETYPEGELRAQLAYRTEVQFVSLDGNDVVPGVPSDHIGVVATTITDIVGWDWTLELAMRANLRGLDDAEEVTLNYGPVGQNGPSTYSLERYPGESDRWFGRALLEEPASAEAHGWYFNVTTPEYPDGELRGQWETQYSEWAGVGEWFGGDFLVRSISPADGSTIAEWPSSVTVTFTRDVIARSATFDSVELMASGGDSSFGEGNELVLSPITVRVDGATITVEFNDIALANDVYRFSVTGIEDAETGEPLADTFFSTFAVDDSHSSPSFALIQQEIFTPNCAQAGCHSGARPAFGLDLSAGVALDNIVNVPSVEQPGLDLVEPGDAEASYIIGKIFQPRWDAHPAGLPQLSNASMQQLRQWIDEGAQNN